MKKGHVIFVFAGLAVISGCGARARLQEEKNLLCTESSLSVAYEASVEVLRDLHFEMETADPAAGYLRTWPLRGSQFFEPWRGDNASAEMAATANLHSIQRIVEIEFVDSMGKTCLEGRAYVRRLSMPGEFYGGTRQMASLFTEGSHKGQSLRLETERLEEEKAAWIDLGRDEALERKLAAEIEKEIQKRKDQ